MGAKSTVPHFWSVRNSPRLSLSLASESNPSFTAAADPEPSTTTPQGVVRASSPSPLVQDTSAESAHTSGTTTASRRAARTGDRPAVRAE